MYSHPEIIQTLCNQTHRQLSIGVSWTGVLRELLQRSVASKKATSHVLQQAAASWQVSGRHCGANAVFLLLMSSAAKQCCWAEGKRRMGTYEAEAPAEGIYANGLPEAPHRRPAMLCCAM